MRAHLAHMDVILLVKVHVKDNVILPVVEAVKVVVKLHVIIRAQELVMYLAYL